MELNFAEKETELTRELQTSQTFAEKCSVELQTRERQLKKLQTKMEDDYKKYTDLNTELSNVQNEKSNEVCERLEAEAKITQL